MKTPTSTARWSAALSRCAGFEQITKVAKTDASVAIYGGQEPAKELVAQAIHLLSRRSQGPLSKVVCGHCFRTLLEASCLGTSAARLRERQAATRRLRTVADGGTLRCWMRSANLCGNAIEAVARVLQEGTFERVGGEQTIKVDPSASCRRPPRSTCSSAKVSSRKSVPLDCRWCR